MGLYCEMFHKGTIGTICSGCCWTFPGEHQILHEHVCFICLMSSLFSADEIWCRIRSSFSKRWVLNPKCSRIIKSPNLVPVRICPDLSRLVQWLSRSPGPGQWLSRSPEPVQDLSSGCPGRQDLLDKKNYLCMSEKVFFSFPRMFVFSFSFSRYPYYVFFLYISGE